MHVLTSTELDQYMQVHKSYLLFKLGNDMNERHLCSKKGIYVELKDDGEYGKGI